MRQKKNRAGKKGDRARISGKRIETEKESFPSLRAPCVLPSRAARKTNAPPGAASSSSSSFPGAAYRRREEEGAPEGN